MYNEIVLETLKQYFRAEISNSINILQDYIELFLSDGRKLKISIK